MSKPNPSFLLGSQFISTNSQRQVMMMVQIRNFAKGKKGEKSSNRGDKKKEAEKAQIYEEFEGQDTDSIQNDFEEALDTCQEELDESLASIKSGRASPTIFNDIMVKAYGEEYPLADLATTMVQGSSNLLIKVFDESVKEEVLKALQRSDFELSLTTEGKDIRCKLGTSRKEHAEAGLKKVKEYMETYKKQAREERHKVLTLMKKLSKVLPEDEVKLMEKSIEEMLKKAETDAKATCDAKDAELKQA